MNNLLDRPATRDTLLVLLRLGLGIVFIAHGWQKVFINGMNGDQGTIANFQNMGIPNPGFSAWAVALLEMLGGAMLILGLLAPLVAGVLALQMIAAIYFVHWNKGFFVEQGGWEFPMILVLALLAIVVFGSGRASLDRALSRFE